MKVFGYVRVSTQKQLEDGTHELQEAAIKKFCKYRDYILVKIYADLGLSGANSDRPQFNLMMKSLDNVDGIVITKIDRLSRDAAELLNHYKLLEKRDKRILTVEQNIDTSEYTGQAFLGLLAVFAELERNMIRERTQAGRENARLKGKKFGRPKKEISKDYLLAKLADGRSSYDIATDLKRDFGIEIHPSTICRRIQEYNIRPKKMLQNS